MIACLSIPGFELKAAVRKSPSLALRPAALAPEPGGEPLLGPVTAAAEAAGVRPGMRLGEALAMCPRLALVDADPAAAEQAWEEIVRSLEDAGFAVESAVLGVAYFETRGVERLYGGLEPALRRALAAAGSAWDARIGAAARRFRRALAAASVARAGQLLVVRDEEATEFLCTVAALLLPPEAAALRRAGSARSSQAGQLAGFPGGAGRTTGAGRPACLEPGEGGGGRVCGRRPPSELAEALEFPGGGRQRVDAAAHASPVSSRRRSRGRNGATVSSARSRSGARLVGGGSWRRTLTLREPSADSDRIRIALAPRLADLPAPVLELRVELVELTEPAGHRSNCSPRVPRTARAALKACARCGRAPAPARLALSWRSHRGRAFPRLARSSFRGTTE